MANLQGSEREKLIEKMCDAHWNSVYEFGCWSKAAEELKQDSYNGMAEALDIAVGELLHPIEKDEHRDAIRRQYGRIEVSPAHLEHGESASLCAHIMNSRRSRYLKPKSDPAFDAAKAKLNEFRNTMGNCGAGDLVGDAFIAEIVAAVRKADHDRV